MDSTGKQGSSNVQLSNPSGIFIDHYGNFFVADEDNGRGSALNQLKEPTHVYVDVVGNLFITDRGNLRVQKWFPGGLEGVTVASGRVYSGHCFPGLSDNRKHANKIYSSESIRGSGRIMKYPIGGVSNVSTYATLLSFVNSTPGNVVLNECNSVYVVESSNGNILKFSSGNPTGEQIATNLISPNDIALDPCGNLYIVGRDFNRVQKLRFEEGDLFC
ncbi:unnamed protein product [Adineta ricciae]|uniref:Uncharacterized protein n=1 Tax=Adineta ricciae TaxID=249248 RepID=A0A815PMM2_ADIRI|nr:unnamed protein product [Adineta ricciae]CAF1616563.1 unnamed protein product [Adineta ricciae]